MSRPVISVENLSKAYRIGLKEEIPDTLAGAFTGFLKSPFRNLRQLSRLDTFRHQADDEDIFWALQDVSFEVQEGEVLGVIGRNGAGKSTLLKILSRITEPTSGRAVIRGRVSSLLEVGTGFHPELSGRENVYLNGTILGMTKAEIDRKFDEIVDFSGVEKFLDTPIKRYSSGMKVRLAFAVAAHLEPEILIIDEVLAVGDAEFQKKCLGKMQSISHSGRTILFVSHNAPVVRSLCTSALFLKNGEVVKYGKPSEILAMYLPNGSLSHHTVYAPPLHSSLPSQLISLRRAEINDATGATCGSFAMNEPISIKVHCCSQTESGDFHAFLNIHRDDGILVLGSASWDALGLGNNRVSTGYHMLECTIPPFLLNAGTYTVSLNGQFPGHGFLFTEENILSFEIKPIDGVGGPKSTHRPGVVRPLLNWKSIHTPL